MSGIYGAFLKAPSVDSEKFKNRLAKIHSIAERTVRDIEVSCPAVVGLISISYTNLLIATGRYFNDVARIKALHSIQTINRPKIAAYFIKWLKVNPVLVNTADRNAYLALNKDERRILMNANSLLIFQVINYFTGLDYNPRVTDNHREEIKTTVRYLLDTNQYSAKSYSLIFQLIDIDPKRSDIPKRLQDGETFS